MGYQAINIGRYDWAAGPDYLKDKLASGKYPLISTNVSFQDSAVSSPSYKIVEVFRGIKVGMLGIMGNEQPHVKIDAKCMSLADTMAKLNELVPSLRNECAMIVVLSDLGQTADINLATKVKGIDVIISSGEAGIAGSPTKIGDTYLTFAIAKGNSIGEYDITFAASGKIKQIAHNFLVLGESIPEDPEIRAEIEKLNKTP